MDLAFLLPYIAIVSFGFLINIPCGFIREGHLKFTFPWFFWISASIPFLIYFRMQLDISEWYIPITVVFAVIGQKLGSRLRRGMMTKEMIQALKQIPNLNIPRPQKVNEREVLVALMNMGGPKTNDDVKDFQKHLFADPLLIRFPLSFLFQNLFAWLLIKTRLKAVKERYMAIGGGSPIYRSTTAQVDALKAELKKRGRNIDVTFAFNYSPPYPIDTIKECITHDKKHLLTLSLYPHYSKATTGSNIHYLKKAAKEIYSNLNFIFPPPYYIADGYIQAFVDKINDQIRPGESIDDFYLVFSAHGLPQYFLNEGDPYPFEINQSVTKILSKLNRQVNWVITYQSAVGPLQWLKPATDDILEELAHQGVRKVLMVPIAFVGDHIETIHEIDIEYRELATKLGITDYRMSKAIETHPGFIKALADSVESAIAR